MPTSAPIPSRPALGLLLASLLLASCGGGGGGPGLQNAPPTVVSAAFLGATSTPSPGDAVRLFISKDVSLVPSTLLDDQDLDLSGGATLGTVTQPPVLVTTRVVEVTLGTGVSFVPNSTTITFSATNDAVADMGGVLGVAATPVVIAEGDGNAPTIDNLTLASVDGELNGTGPAGGTLQSPQHLFTIDLAYSDPSSPVDPSKTQIAADVPVGTPSGTQAAGTNLRSFFTELSANASAASYEVPTTVSFPAGPVTITAFVVDLTGMVSPGSSFSFQVRLFSDVVRPFETSVNASQVWFIQTNRDVESYTVNLGNPTTPVEVNQGANGTPDLEDLLLTIGLRSTTPIPNVSMGKDSNEVAFDRIGAEMLADLGTLFAGANVQFTFTQPPGDFPLGTSSVPYANLGYSRICLAGAEDPAGNTGVLGVALFDPNNASQNDNCLTDFQMSQRLGVFLHTLVNQGFLELALTPFRTTFDPFTPSRGGTPIGEVVLDDGRLTGMVTDARSMQIDAALDGIARFAAVVLAHECGHSMGLVMNGAMPAGLYGGDPANFPGSADGHIRNTSLFPPGSINVMSPALSYSLALSPQTSFNTLNLAYLRERVLYDN